jgi:hypothetical protein
MKQINSFLVALSVSLSILAFGLVHALIQHPPYSPEIEAQQYFEGAIESQKEAEDETRTTAILDKGHAPGHSKKAEEGTEFWPPLFGHRIKITDSLLVAFTFGLTVFTWLLWKSTAGLFAVTKIVADADRPHMIPSEIAIVGIRKPAENGFVSVGIDYKFINYGRSPAFMKKFCLMVRVGSLELEPTPEYQESTDTNLIIVVNGWWGTTAVHPSSISVAEADVTEILAETARMLIIGYIEYGDTASQIHKMRFCYHLLFGAGDRSVQFRPFGPDSYREYT